MRQTIIKLKKYIYIYKIDQKIENYLHNLFLNTGI